MMTCILCSQTLILTPMPTPFLLTHPSLRHHLMGSRWMDSHVHMPICHDHALLGHANPSPCSHLPEPSPAYGPACYLEMTYGNSMISSPALMIIVSHQTRPICPPSSHSHMAGMLSSPTQADSPLLPVYVPRSDADPVSHLHPWLVVVVYTKRPKQTAPHPASCMLN